MDIQLPVIDFINMLCDNIAYAYERITDRKSQQRDDQDVKDCYQDQMMEVLDKDCYFDPMMEILDKISELDKEDIEYLMFLNECELI